MPCGIVEGILGNSVGFLLSDHLEPLHHTRDTLMLQPTILSFRVLTDHHNVNVLVPGERGEQGERVQDEGVQGEGV